MSSQASKAEKPYYESVSDESTLTRKTSPEATLAKLLEAPDWKSAASQWGRKQLLAHRVICSQPAAQLSFLEPWLQKTSAANECLRKLVEGPKSIHALQDLSETQIVHGHQPDSLGYVWAAFLPFLRPNVGPGGSVKKATTEEDVDPSQTRPRRERNPPVRLGASAPPQPHSEGSDSSSSYGSSSGSSYLSAAFMEKESRSPNEDAGIRLVSCFVRCVLNYGQPVDKEEPFVEFRDERRMYSSSCRGKETIRAVDDGGMQILTSDRQTWHQVALLESKRNVQKVNEGVAGISDELLGQMVGEALTLQLNSPDLKSETSRTDVVTILVATHWVKLFHFTNSQDYLKSYQERSTDESQGLLVGNLRVNSTAWLDLKTGKDRKTFASHVLALVAWANDQLA